MQNTHLIQKRPARQPVSELAEYVATTPTEGTFVLLVAGAYRTTDLARTSAGAPEGWREPGSARAPMGGLQHASVGALIGVGLSPDQRGRTGGLA